MNDTCATNTAIANVGTKAHLNPIDHVCKSNPKPTCNRRLEQMTASALAINVTLRTDEAHHYAEITLLHKWASLAPVSSTN